MFATEQQLQNEDKETERHERITFSFRLPFDNEMLSNRLTLLLSPRLDM